MLSTSTTNANMISPYICKIFMLFFMDKLDRWHFIIYYCYYLFQQSNTFTCALLTDDSTSQTFLVFVYDEVNWIDNGNALSQVGHNQTKVHLVTLPAICINSMLTKFHWLCIMGLKGALLFCSKIHTDGDYKMTQKAWKFSARWRSCSSKKSFKKRSNCGRWTL